MKANYLIKSTDVNDKLFVYKKSLSGLNMKKVVVEIHNKKFFKYKFIVDRKQVIRLNANSQYDYIIKIPKSLIKVNMNEFGVNSSKIMSLEQLKWRMNNV